jgi:hypothetical protein
MQDRYVGDVGDYGKYGLLRALARHSADCGPLAIVWCRYPDESHNSDGRHTSYLSSPAFAGLDPELHSTLRGIISRKERRIKAVQQAGIFQPDTIYFEDTPHAVAGAKPSQRIAARAEWRARALDATCHAGVVFFDPDNGLETKSVPKSHPKAGKYIYWDDLLPFWTRGQSLIVYHHLNRTSPAAVQTAALRHEFMMHFGSVPFLDALLFRRGSCRHFWVVGQKRHANFLRDFIRKFLDVGWHAHFSSIE